MYCSREVLPSRERVSYNKNAFIKCDKNIDHVVKRLPFYMSKQGINMQRGG